MKLTVFIDKEREEEVLVYAHEENALVRAIRQVTAAEDTLLVGYRGQEAIRLHPHEVCCFVVEEGRVYALVGEARWLLKCRLYQLEERLGAVFVKLNQSCLANPRHMERFDASIAGALTVTFRNGYKDYVSRRQLKLVKERLGL